MKAYFKHLLVGLFCIGFTHSFGQGTPSNMTTLKSKQQVIDSLLQKYLDLYPSVMASSQFRETDDEIFKLEMELKKYPSGKQMIDKRDAMLKESAPQMYLTLQKKRKAYQDAHNVTDEEVQALTQAKEKELEALKGRMEQQQNALKANNRFKTILLLCGLLVLGAVVLLILRKRYNKPKL